MDHDGPYLKSFSKFFRPENYPTVKAIQSNWFKTIFAMLVWYVCVGKHFANKHGIPMFPIIPAKIARHAKAGNLWQWGPRNWSSGPEDIYQPNSTRSEKYENITNRLQHSALKVFRNHMISACWFVKQFGQDAKTIRVGISSCRHPALQKPGHIWLATDQAPDPTQAPSVHVHKCPGIGRSVNQVHVLEIKNRNNKHLKTYLVGSE